MHILITAIIIAMLGGATYAGVEKLRTPKEGEITIVDLMEQARVNVPGSNIEAKKLGVSTSEPTYSGTLLVPVPSSDQKLIREGGNKVSYPIFAPTKVPKGFELRPTSISSGVQNKLTTFQIFFSNKKGDNLFIYQYGLTEYLAVSGKTLTELTSDKKWQTIGQKRIYIPDAHTKTDGRFQYLQGLTLVTDTTLIRVEYFGEQKLSSEDLRTLGISFVK